MGLTACNHAGVWLRPLRPIGIDCRNVCELFQLLGIPFSNARRLYKFLITRVRFLKVDNNLTRKRNTQAVSSRVRNYRGPCVGGRIQLLEEALGKAKQLVPSAFAKLELDGDFLP